MNNILYIYTYNCIILVIITSINTVQVKYVDMHIHPHGTG